MAIAGPRRFENVIERDESAPASPRSTPGDPRGRVQCRFPHYGRKNGGILMPPAGVRAVTFRSATAVGTRRDRRRGRNRYR